MLTPAAHIHHAADEHGILLLDIRTEKWAMLGPDSSRIWQAIVATGTTAGLADQLAIPTGRDPHAALRGIDHLADRWKRDGILIDRARAPRRRWWRR